MIALIYSADLTANGRARFDAPPTTQAGLGVCKMGIDYPKGVIKNIVPIVMAGVLGIYGLIVAVILTQQIREPSADGYTKYSLFNGYGSLAAGLCCGISCLAGERRSCFIVRFLPSMQRRHARRRK